MGLHDRLTGFSLLQEVSTSAASRVGFALFVLDELDSAHRVRKMTFLESVLMRWQTKRFQVSHPTEMVEV